MVVQRGAVLISCLVCACAIAQPVAQFVPLGFFDGTSPDRFSAATGLSGDGSTVVGLSQPAITGMSTSFRWRVGDSSLTPLP